MLALNVTPGVKNSIRLDDIDQPTPSPSQALLRVQEIGICGTDLDINQGFYGEAPPGFWTGSARPGELEFQSEYITWNFNWLQARRLWLNPVLDSSGLKPLSE